MALVESDVAWLAGVYEGEGSCQKHGSGIRLMISQKDEWLCRRLLQLFGGYVFPTNNKEYGKNWRWQVSNEEACALALRIIERLSPRRQDQLLPVMEHWLKRAER